MSLEGNLRDLALEEVLQLLAHGRKSGELRISAQLAGLSATVVFARGAIVDAFIASAASAAATGGGARITSQVESTALELITWREGTFVFVPSLAGEHAETGVRLATEMLLVEGARRMEGWARLADRIPHARAVPAFVSVEPRQRPLLQLVPQQWEVLTRVDGQRDLPALAEALGRDLLDVAEIVHGLIGTGLLRLAESARAMRTNATPPSAAIMDALPASVAQPCMPGADTVRNAAPVVTSTPAQTATSSPASTNPTATPLHESGDFWVPADAGLLVHGEQHADDSYDAIFDPVRVGVITPDGLPRLRTPMHQPAIHPGAPRPAHARGTVTLVNSDHTGNDAARNPRRAGDDAARRGDFAEALSQWSAYLKLNENGADADHVREAIAVAARLHALLSTSAQG